MIKLIKKITHILWRSLNFLRNLLTNLFFIFSLLLFLFVFIQASKNINKKPEQPRSAALVLNLNGKLVEQKQPIRLMEQISKNINGNDEAVEIELNELIHAINTAAKDKAITALILELDLLHNTQLSKLQEVGAAIERFKKSKKPVLAIGEHYSQEQYYLASYADTLYLNPAGSVSIYGYGRYQLYLKSALEKLMVTPHVFRVGSYKSAVEPFIRDDMSPQARADAQRWLDKLWQQYVSDVATQREIKPYKVAPNLEQFQQAFKAVNGDQAQYALQAGLVDELKTRPELLATLQKLVGKDNKGQSYARIDYNNYIRLINKPFSQKIKTTEIKTDSIALITAAGSIVNGKQPAGTIGSDTLGNQLLQARLDDNVKAVVLRIDSPGGSAFASEIIRNEIQAIQADGKPVVVSMGSYAASGGYWIAAGADKIFASATTITGSIGIFGLFPTFENALAHFGIYSDGVSTGPFAGIGVTQALPEHVAQSIQMGVESGYRKFIHLVAQGRGMTATEVDNIAQGRIWTGSEAKEIGLVDEIGDLNAAISAAAELAQISHYQVRPIKDKLSPQEKILMDLFGNAVSHWQLQQNNPLQNLMQALQKEVGQFAHFNDPQGRYALCPVCK